MKTKFKLLALSASLLACGIGASGQAQANAYAVSTNNIKDGLVVGLFDGVSVGTGIPGIFTFGAPSSTSSSSATLSLTGVGIGTGTSGSSSTSPPDAPASNGTGSNPIRTNENVFTTGAGNTYYNLFGQLNTHYSSGDAIVVTEQSPTGTPIVARNMAESNIPTNKPGFGDADGRNISSTTVNLGISIGKDCDTHDCRVNFSFLADPFILASLDALAKPGSVARGTLAMSITLTKIDQSYMFSWAPNGAIGLQGTCAAGQGLTIGGCETADAENLNLTREVLNGGNPDATHSAPYANDIFGTFGAFTNALGSGEYTLSLSMIEKTDVKRVPEPATLALLGLGMSGLAFVRRRKQA